MGDFLDTLLVLWALAAWAVALTLLCRWSFRRGK